jgi:hypothetical protein
MLTTISIIFFILAAIFCGIMILCLAVCIVGLVLFLVFAAIKALFDFLMGNSGAN